jgi:4-carboxymuconolactone decarboxylase
MHQEESLFNDAMRHLVRIAGAIAGAPIAVTRRVMTAALPSVTPDAVDEVLLQSYLFAGFPRALNAASAWREVSGIAAPQSDAAASLDASGDWVARGESVCRTIYGAKYAALRRNIRHLHPALDLWMLTDGYGKVLSRPGLTLAQRELCIVAACAASEQQPQFRSHLRGALNCGATYDDLAQTLSALADFVPRDTLAQARKDLARLKEK